jgi:hypothetical protein
MSKEIIEIKHVKSSSLPWIINCNEKENAFVTKEEVLKEAYAIYWLRQLEIRLDPKKQNRRSGIQIIINDTETNTQEEIAVNLKPEAFDIFLSRYELFTSDDSLLALKEKRNIKRIVNDNILVTGRTVRFKGKEKPYGSLEDAEKEAEILFWYRQFRDYFFPDKAGINGTSLTKFKPRNKIETTYYLQDGEIETVLNSWADVIKDDIDNSD